LQAVFAELYGAYGHAECGTAARGYTYWAGTLVIAIAAVPVPVPVPVLVPVPVPLTLKVATPLLPTPLPLKEPPLTPLPSPHAASPTTSAAITPSLAIKYLITTPFSSSEIGA